MTRRLRVEWAPGEKVTALSSGDGSGPLAVVLAHGAGAGQRHPFVLGLRQRLASSGMPTVTFDYPYMEAGRRAPDRLEKLAACHRAVVARVQDRFDRVVLAGKSMGGRVGGHVADATSAGLIFYGYPLVPLGKSEARDTSHLDALGAPMLFVQGTRDPLGPLDQVSALARRLGARLETVPDGDHSYRVPKRSGRTADDVLDSIAGWTVDFAAGL